MQRDSTSRVQTWLILFLLGLAVILSLVIFGLLRERSTARQAVEPAVGEPSSPGEPAAPAARNDEATPAASSVPTPTFVPLEANVPAPQPTGAIAPGPDAQPISTPVPAAQPPAPSAAPAAARGSSVQLDDSAWQGGYRSARGYGRRSATWIYGTGTEYSTMQAAVALPAQPRGTAVLTIEGMDSEDRAKTTIQITVNDVEIFRGANPLPNDDLPLESGRWGQATFPFDAALLRPGSNTIRITNLKPGRFSLPPFFMLDYALLSFDTAGGTAP